MALRNALPGRKRLLNGIGLLLIVLLVAPFVAFAVPQAIGANGSYIVMSGSMEPTIQTGGVVWAYEPEDPSSLQEGTIITYDVDDDRREVTTHRIVDVQSREGNRVYVTQGDANDEPDPYVVGPSDVIGVVPSVYGQPVRLPFVGRFLLFAQTQMGLGLLVFLPAGLLVLTEVWSLYSAATSGGDGTQTEQSTEQPSDGEAAVPEEGD